MIDESRCPTPNNWKFSILLEECGRPYRLVSARIGRGERFTVSFMGFNPNGSSQALVRRVAAVRVS
jgi:GST-like protein